MHIEEIFKQGQKPDTTAGMMRFLIGHFRAVVNKILPDLPDDVKNKLLEEDGEYFNDLAYDDVVEAIAHVLLVSNRLYVKGVERPDEKNDRHRFSKVKGLHFMPWEPAIKKSFQDKFNEYGWSN